MTIRVNDETKTLADSVTILALMSELGLAERKGVAVAINGRVIPRVKWPQQTLAEQDNVLLIRATQGG